MPTTTDVLNHHLEAFGKGDLEGLLSDYTDTSIVFTPQGVLRGVREIRPVFAAFIEEFGKPGATFTMDRQAVEGEAAYLIWSAETADNVYAYATDTFIVRNGKIAIQSFAGKIEPKKTS
jgi:ketosteroid isomerase-like protein